MQVRHRIPSIFNLSMVDVLCCALGCIILLWLVYFKEARERSIAAGHINKELTATKLKLDTVLSDLLSSQATLLAGKQRNEFLSGQLDEVLSQRDQLLAKWEKTDRDRQAALKSLEDARAVAAGLRKDVKDLETRNAGVQAALADKNKDLDVAALQTAELKSKLAQAEQGATKLEQDVATLKVVSKEFGHQVAKIESKAMGLEADLAKRMLEIADANKRLSELLTLKDRLEQHLAAAKTDLAKSAVAEKDLSAAAKTNVARITRLEQDLAAARTDLAKMAQLEKDFAAAKTDLAKNAVLEKNLSAARSDLARMAQLEKDLNAAKTDLTKSALLEKNLSAAARSDLARIAQLEQYLSGAKNDLGKTAKELADARALQVSLAGETKDLTQQLGQYKAAADNRFAGIEMTGSRVLFLVDMSGSMGMKNDDTPDPEKWPHLCEVLAKLMKSLPDLKQFQIILFSDRVRYPLGNEGAWHNYSGPASVKIAVETVRAVSPQNATNMSAAFEEAFRYRAMGLDTIYFLSDGLPNMGDGLPANAARLSEAEREAALGKYIRDRLKTKWNLPYGRWSQQRVRINAVGFYFDSPDVGAFLWALARDNNGSFVGLSKP